MSQRYILGIRVFELSKLGNLTVPCDTTPEATGKGLRNLFLVRHRGVYFNSVVQHEQKLQFPGDDVCS